MSNKTFTASVQVRWGDSDRYGHVNNTLFAEYMQEARVQWLTDVLVSGRVTDGGASVVRKMTIDFLRPVTDQASPLQVEVSVLQVGSSSFTVRHVVSDAAGSVYAIGDAVMVAFNTAAQAPRKLGDQEANVLRDYLAEAPAEEG